MSELRPLLDIVSALKITQASKRILVIELSETRLASLLLRPSPIWTFAIVEQPRSSNTWSSQWQWLTSPGQASSEDIHDLRTEGSTPGIGGKKRIDLKPVLQSEIAQISPVIPDCILPIGSLCEMKAFGDVIKAHFPSMRILPARRTFALPANLGSDFLRSEIEDIFQPKMDTDYSLQTAALENGKLEIRPVPIITKGDLPPSALTFHGKKLYRAIEAESNHSYPINILIQNENGTLLACRAVPPKNVFYLQWWINYKDDQLGFRLVDDQASKQPSTIPCETLTESEASKPITLPEVKAVRNVDILFILDGTMRSKISSGSPPQDEWIPDIDSAKKFIVDIVKDMDADKMFAARCALCLYGDWKYSGQADYELRHWPFQLLSKFEGMLEHDSGISATGDRDYEALLEAALHWANSNNLQWRPDANRFLIVIGYAPPHPPHGKLHDAGYGFTHEPFTSGFDWRKELAGLRQTEINVISVWNPYSDLDRKHRCMRYSHDVWYELGNHEDFYVSLEDTTRAQINKLIQVDERYQAQGAIPLPLATPIPSLRCKI